MTDYPMPPYQEQKQPMPGSTEAMKPRPDHGETSYKGSGRLQAKRAIITGGGSGIGRAVAIALAGEAEQKPAFVEWEAGDPPSSCRKPKRIQRRVRRIGGGHGVQ